MVTNLASKAVSAERAVKETQREKQQRAPTGFLFAKGLWQRQATVPPWAPGHHQWVRGWHPDNTEIDCQPPLHFNEKGSP